MLSQKGWDINLDIKEKSWWVEQLSWIQPDQSEEFSWWRNHDFGKGMVEGQWILQHSMEKEIKHQEGFIFLLKM